MKYEIKQLNNTDAVVISDGKIKENTNTFKEGINGDWFWCSKYNKIAHTGDITSFDFKIIATISPFKIEGLHMLELDNQEEDIKKLAIKSTNDNFESGNSQWINGFIEGCKAAQKQYSEEDIIKAFETGRNYQLTGENNFNELLQSLQKNQFPIAVELTEDLQVIKWHYEKES